MTYAELIVELNKLTEDQLSDDVTVFDGDEYREVTFYIEEFDDVLHKGHAVISIPQLQE